MLSCYSIAYNFFDKKTSGSSVKSEIMPNQRLLDLAMWQLAEELQKTIIRKFEKQNVYSSF